MLLLLLRLLVVLGLLRVPCTDPTLLLQPLLLPLVLQLELLRKLVVGLVVMVLLLRRQAPAPLGLLLREHSG